MRDQHDRNKILDRRGRQLIRRVQFEGHLDEKTFLARFHQKLRASIPFELDPSLSAWCWRLAPVTGAASLVLGAILFMQGPVQPVSVDPTEQVLTLLGTDNGEGDLIVEALLHVEGGE